MSRQSSLAVLLIVVTAAIFWQVHRFDFVWDDAVNITGNPYMARPSWTSLGRFWERPYAYLYVPLTYTVWLILARGMALWNLLGGGEAQLWPGPFHLANLLVHILSVLAVFAILRKLVRQDWPAVAGALLFAVHPVQAEPVAWVTGLKDLLAGLLSLVSVWQYLAYAESGGVARVSVGANAEKKAAAVLAGSVRKRKRLHYSLATVSFVLALVAKPTAAVLPAALWVLDYILVGRSARVATRALAGWVLLALPIAVVAKTAQTAELVEFITPLWFRPLLFADAIGFYLFKLVFPLRLTIDYGRSAQWVVTAGWQDFFWVLPCLLAVLIWFNWKRRPWLIAAAALFVIGILPVSGLSLFAFQNISIVADRYLYFAILGAAFALASLLSERGGKLPLTIAFAMLTLLSVATAAQLSHWRDNQSLFARALEINPNSWLARSNVATLLVQQGNLDEAVSQFRALLRMKPTYADAYNNLGSALSRQGKLDEAVELYHEALRINPTAAMPHTNLANIHTQRGEAEKAIHHYREAVRLDPEYFEAHQKLGELLFNRGEIAEAIPHLEEALRGNAANLEDYNNLAIALAKSGRIDEALRFLRSMLLADPSNAGAHNNLGIILAGTGQLEDGAEQFREAVRLRPEFAQAHENLSRALMMLGKQEEAFRHHNEAQRLEAAAQPAAAQP